MNEAKFYVVHFHADGGQMCVPGNRTFSDQTKAEAFANKMRNEPDHRCGPESVSIEEADEPRRDDGAIYPAIARLGRP